MSKSVNQVILMGRLTRDPELRTTASGKNIASFSLAVDKGGADGGADFFDVTAWEKTADLVSQYTQKGSKVLIMGRLGQDSWDDKETGKKRSKVTITVNDVTFLSEKGEANTQSGRDVGATSEDMDKPVDLNEIPF